MHHDQLYIDSEIARRMIGDQFPQYRHEDVIPLTSAGTSNAIFRIGAKSAARFPLRAGNPLEYADLLRLEAAAASEFAEVCIFPTPQWIASGEPGPGYPMPWTVQTWIEGEIATPAELSASTTFALDLVNLVASLRQGDTRGRPFDGRGRGGNLGDHDDWMEVCFSRSEDLIEVSQLRRLWSVFRELPPARTELMSHKDLIPTNLLVRGERLMGVLDAGSFGPADFSLDLMVAWHLLDHERREVFRDAIQASELEWKRGAAWAFLQAMGLIWYYRVSNPAMNALGRSTISRLLEDR